MTDDAPKLDPTAGVFGEALTDAIMHMIEEKPAEWEGFYAVRFGRDRPEVGAAIRIMSLAGQPVQLACYIDGREVPLEKMAARLRGRGNFRRIDEATYRWLVDDRAWARRFAPHTPEARPHERVDLRQVDPVLPPKRKSPNA